MLARDKKVPCFVGMGRCLLLILSQQDDLGENFSFGINVLGHSKRVSCFVGKPSVACVCF